MGVEIKLTHGLTLSPRMMLSAKILQMSTPELSEYIRRLSEENPAFDLEPNTAGREKFRSLSGRFPGENSAATYSLNDLENEPDQSRESIRDSLLSQLDAMTLSADIYAVARFIINSLGDDGMLEQSAKRLRKASGTDENVFSAALATVRYMEPAGVAAEDLSECLLLQLQRFENRDPLAELIVRDHLRLLAKNRLDIIGQKLNASPEDIARACKVIKTLSPKPAVSYGGSERVLVTPDCFVYRDDDGRLTLDFVDAFLPSLSISPYYAQMLKQNDDAEVRDYLNKKISEARLTIYSVQQRKNTVLRCVAYIADYQKDFFENGPGHLNPLTMADIAEKLELNTSTVSRAVRGKYIQCDYGLFPVKHFLSRKLGSGSSENARMALRLFIENEPAGAPLSDEKLTSALREKGFEISRRTVAKYRLEMTIPDTSGRRRK